MRNKPTIAVVCNFPIWEVAPHINKPGMDHYAVWLSAMAKSLKDQDVFDIHWITLCKQVWHPEIHHALNQTFHILPRLKKTIGLYTRYFFERWTVRNYLRRLNPDLTHFWGNEDCYGLCGANYPGNKLLSIQGILTVCIQRGGGSAFEKRHSRFEIPTLNSFPAITAESPWADEQISKLSNKKNIIRLEYAVEQCFFTQQRCITPHPTCLYVGSDTPLKNVDQLINAFSDHRLADIHLILAGVSPRNRSNLPDNISALGRVSREKVAELMSSSWVLLHASKVDTGPTVVKEARVVGLPVVISTECGCKQYITHGENGYIIAPDDTESLIRAVLDLTSSPGRNLAAGSYEQEKCRNALSRETMRNRLLQIYNSLLRKA
ncbi:MAG: glycosyltransferase family 4 protein [Akkermansia muciniphila]